jgi:tetratricopeptide (TPR) repeat protein
MNLTLARKQNILYYTLSLVTMLLAMAAYLTMQPSWVAFRQAESLYYAKSYAEAIPLYQRSLEEGKTTPKAVLHLAEALTAEGHFAQSAQYYRMYLESYPKARAIREKLAKTLFWDGNIEESTKEYELLLEE